MTRIFFALGTIAMVAATPVGARDTRHRALPPVPQSAEIAALNRESLAKIAPASSNTPSVDTQKAPPAPAIKKGARPRR
ncbi:hypothetical protein KZX46_04905 [Polymorphobacter sp. PAMC 29334]|uniref:hypothetical protein n=1 Tax=Polymorphobacter sp. PAMC 29334 TaxID=2862331 RepID=UPI001C74AE18|nr:hypothetical protein [Polymorphobacter sp. PAMC 29334]QYE35331.1 hypothetical protein KZX46_04905 [Polymorphobacter sp. PAMC 29334]